MKYLLLIYSETVVDGMPEAEAEQQLQECGDYTDHIKQSGHLLGVNRLKPSDTATTIRMRNGRMLTSDGPFAETREQLGGYFLIDAGDLDEAIGIAARIPMARKGTVEIRPVIEIAGLPCD